MTTPAPDTTEQRPPRPWHSLAFRVGTGFFVLGCLPLPAAYLVSRFLLGDPNPNPVGPGLLAAISFWPAVIGIGWGLASTAWRWARACGAKGQPRDG